MSQPRNPFTRTGALRLNHPLFRGRTVELERLEQACLDDSDAFILLYGGRQNGKTSLLLRLEDRLRSQLSAGVRVCRVDFQGLPRATTAIAYQHLAQQVAQSLPQAPRPPELPSAPALTDFVEHALAGTQVTRLVLLLDELGTLPEDTREDLAHVLRSLHTRRLISPALGKLQFVLTGGIELYTLAVVEASALRNVCDITQLGDLSETDAVALLADGLGMIGVAAAQAQALGDAVYARVAGHPYLTQRLGALLADQQLRGRSPDEAQVDAAAFDLLEQDDSLLEHLRRGISDLRLADAARRLVGTSQRTSRTDDGVARLELLGLARRHRRYWVPRNPLLAVAMAEWLGLPVPTNGDLLQAAAATEQVALARYLAELRREQAGITKQLAGEIAAAEQARLQRRAETLADEIAELEKAQPPEPIAATPPLPDQTDQKATIPLPPETLVDEIAELEKAQPPEPIAATPPMMSTPSPPTATVSKAPKTATSVEPARREAPRQPAPAAEPRPSASIVAVPAWLPELVHVPAGSFLMGSSDADKLASNDERPQHRLELPDYWIGKTPVTNAQFRLFVEGQGYTDPKYWIEAGWQWRQSEKITKPAYWVDPQWNGADYPVVGVSWFEAVAYCRWLSVQTGQEFRLPSEPEWEKVARGADGRVWPWGNTWTAKRANSKEVGSGKTTPVGQYPDGAGPYGALDMAGNVWEWCATKWGKSYPYQIEDEWQAAYLAANEQPVLRGGAWHNEQKHVRASYRFSSFDPRVRGNTFGLRVASHSRSGSGS